MKTFQLKPSCKDFLWGGEKLRTEYGIQSDLHPLSEAWVLSCHPDGQLSAGRQHPAAVHRRPPRVPGHWM